MFQGSRFFWLGSAPPASAIFRYCQDGEGHYYIIDLDTRCAAQLRSQSCSLASGGFAVKNSPNAQKAFSSFDQLYPLTSQLS